MYTFKPILSTILLLTLGWIQGASAARDPIGWSASQTLPPVINSPQSIIYTFTNHIPHTLVHPLIIEKQASPASEFTFTDTCSGQHLLPNQSCTVTVNLTPNISGIKEAYLTIANYSDDRVPLQLRTIYDSSSTHSGVTVTQNTSFYSPAATGTVLPFLFTFQNVGDVDATSLNLTVLINGSTATSPAYTTTCGTSVITLTKSGGTCTVSGNYTVLSSPTNQTVVATLTYSGASGSPVSTTTSTSPSGASSGDLIGSWVGSNYLAPVFSGPGPITLQGLFTATTNIINGSPVAFTCTDITSSSVCSANLSISPPESCTNAHLNAGAQCQVQLNLSTTGFTSGHQYTVEIKVPNNGTPTPATLSTSGTYVASLPTTRTVKLINNCTFPVWWSLSGGSTGASISSCPTGQTSNGSYCYWNNPVPSPVPANHQLAAGGGNTFVQIPLSQNYQNIVWSGTISASLNCDGTTACLQAGCGNAGGSTSCAVGQGFTPPVTQAEITMLYQGVDSYDAEVINGYHIPISMAPANFDDTGTLISSIPASNYSCGVPGNQTASNGFGACDWQTPSLGSGVNNIPGYGYLWVSGTQASDDLTHCNIATPLNNCSSGTICGLNSNLKQVCGEFYGFWSADQVCGMSTASSGVRTYFSCDTSFTSGQTVQGLLQCVVPTGYNGANYNSCYLTYPNGTDTSVCCGCKDWWNAGIVSNSNTQSCGTQTNPNWNNSIQPKIQWMKNACPSVYTYPFDDKTSSFTCTNGTTTSVNSTGYIVTFCPGGNTGMPTSFTGVNDGR